MEIIREENILALQLTNKEAIDCNLFNQEDKLQYNIEQVYCSCCGVPFSNSDTCYLCGDSDELLCFNCWYDYCGNCSQQRELGAQVRKLNKFLEKNNIKKRINNKTYELEDY